MENLLSWIGAGFGALFVVAVAVAWWEHLVRSARPQAPDVVVRRAVNVDVALDRLHEMPAGDAPSRQAALDGALDRMTGAAPAPAAAWIDTRPTVLQATAAAQPASADAAPSTRG